MLATGWSASARHRNRLPCLRLGPAAETWPGWVWVCWVLERRHRWPHGVGLPARPEGSCTKRRPRFDRPPALDAWTLAELVEEDEEGLGRSASVPPHAWTKINRGRWPSEYIRVELFAEPRVKPQPMQKLMLTTTSESGHPTNVVAPVMRKLAWSRPTPGYGELLAAEIINRIAPATIRAATTHNKVRVSGVSVREA